MKSLGSWDAALAAPAPADHFVQFYDHDDALGRTAAAYLAAALARDEAAVIISTPAHWSAIAARLAADGVDVPAREQEHQITVRDAESCVARVVGGGVPDREAFRALLTPALDGARAAGYDKVRAYGEMVDVLLNRDGNLVGAIGLEKLWNELLAEQQLSLLCVYALDTFDREAQRAAVPGICAVHSHLMPVADVDRLERAVGRAFADVYGADGDAAVLQGLLAARLPGETAMPAGQAAMMTLRALDARAADLVLARARGYYSA